MNSNFLVKLAIIDRVRCRSERRLHRNWGVSSIGDALCQRPGRKSLWLGQESRKAGRQRANLTKR